MRFAYADPPYLGCGARLYGSHHADASLYDTLDGHRDLIGRLCREYPDGWAYSLSSTTLRDILPLVPGKARVMAWVKPFASFKPNVRLAYAWEPVILCGGRQDPARDEPTVRDWCAANITMKRGLPGAKPIRFCLWLFDALGCRKGDALDDLFPGTGIVSAVFRSRYWGVPMKAANIDLFDEIMAQPTTATQ